jgi:hypothetical protein
MDYSIPKSQQYEAASQRSHRSVELERVFPQAKKEKAIGLVERQ